jgi:hypothetical protein
MKLDLLPFPSYIIKEIREDYNAREGKIYSRQDSAHLLFY